MRDIENITKAKALLKHIRFQLKMLEKINPMDRGHIDNEDLQKLHFKEKQLQTVIKMFKVGELKPIAPKKRISPQKFNNGEYF